MKRDLRDYYNNVVKKPAYWFPILLLALVAFGFDLFNRTISVDDLNREYYNQAMLHSRWGMVIWNYLMGLMDYNAYIDKFVALCFLILSACGIGFIYYNKDKTKNVTSYTLISCFIISFPLINEIWNYNGANFYSTGGLLLCVCALCIINTSYKQIWRYLIAGLLLVLPVSGYESPVFSYLTLICILLFYEYVVVNDKQLGFKKWIRIVFDYAVPLIVAVVIRFFVSIALYVLFGIQYFNTGNVGCMWLHGNIIDVAMTMISDNFFLYFVAGLVYKPIGVFALLYFAFVAYFIIIAIKRKEWKPFLLGLLIILSVFSLSILTGMKLEYHTAQTTMIFASFVFYLLVRWIVFLKQQAWKVFLLVLMFGLCWHQSVYINKLQDFNNLRSDNEAAAIHNIGMRLLSEYERKPVVFVSRYSVGDWIDSRTKVDKDNWNGKLFCRVCDAMYNSSKANYKYIDSNINAVTQQQNMLKHIFMYYGYNIDVIMPILENGVYSNLDSYRKILEEADKVAKESQMRPYEIMDKGNYIIVQMGTEVYYADYYIF